LLAISKQHHGSEHEITKDIESRLSKCKTTYVNLQRLGLFDFEVIRHEEDKYVVGGPKEVAEERKETLRVDEADVTIHPYGAPVVIHGFKN
jgi:hypothetical protein